MSAPDAVPVEGEKPPSGPWNPGIGPEIPRELLPLSTVFRAENVFTSIEHVHEFRDFTGLELQELVVFRPERLAVHELLLRITADLSVPAGEKVEDLGINFRRMASTLQRGYIDPAMPQIVAAYEEIRATLIQCVEAELSETLFSVYDQQSSRSESSGWLERLGEWFGKSGSANAPVEDELEREERIRRDWHTQGHDREDPLRAAACRALDRAVSAMRIEHGCMWADRELLARIASGIACNDYASERIGEMLEPLIKEAVDREGFTPLSVQTQPVVLNTKGASASGKSTLRPLQRKLVERLEVDWADFALISPDIWRKYLLDYESLGEHYKYAAALTGVELELLDHKLDRYMADKAERGHMSHLLIDRFRFDNLVLESNHAGSNLLTRFGNLIYMFFVVTPPHETVERSWRRGLEVGRYKAVEDVLGHNVEAFSGMPEMFFTWALRTSKSVHYEFLDNDVPLGQAPYTGAFGYSGEMNILDVKCMLDIDRYRKINVHGTSPDTVYPSGGSMAAENNTHFLQQCVKRLPWVNFVNQDTGEIYARFEAARLIAVSSAGLARAMADEQTRAGLLAVAPDIDEQQGRHDEVLLAEQQSRLIEARFHTLGRWAEHG